MGDGLFGVDEAVMHAERRQKISRGGRTDARNRLEQVPSLLQIGMMVDMALDLIAGRGQFLGS